MTDWVNSFSDEIARDVPAFRHERVKSSTKSGLPEGNWFYFELTPVSARPERVAQVLSDLLSSYPLFEIGRNGCVLPDETGPLRECVLSDKDRDIIRFIKPELFRIAMWEGSPNSECHEFLNYPVFFTLWPEINHITFPFHPHLNLIVQSHGVILPQSLCYERNYSEMGTDKYECAMSAYVRICIWLFRHQVWISRRGDQLRRWPGAEEPTEMRQIDGCKQANLRFGCQAAITQGNIKSLFRV